MTSVYQRMLDRGVNMSWYARGKKRLGPAGGPIPLDDQACSSGSVYLMDASGKLWTLDGNHKPHKVVRETEKKLPHDVFVCVHTKATYEGWQDAVTHGRCSERA